MDKNKDEYKEKYNRLIDIISKIIEGKYATEFELAKALQEEGNLSLQKAANLAELIYRGRKSLLITEKPTISKEQFARQLGFSDYSELTGASEEIFADWYIASLQTGDVVVWDDSKLMLNRINYYSDYQQAEDASVVSYIYNHNNKQNAVLEMFIYMHERIKNDHYYNEGCKHKGCCQLVSVFVDFIACQKGKKTLGKISKWWGGQNLSEVYEQIFGGSKFDTSKWIAEEEIPSWLEEVQAAGLKKYLA